MLLKAPQIPVSCLGIWCPVGWRFQSSLNGDSRLWAGQMPKTKPPLPKTSFSHNCPSNLWSRRPVSGTNTGHLEFGCDATITEQCDPRQVFSCSVLKFFEDLGVRGIQQRSYLAYRVAMKKKLDNRWRKCSEKLELPYNYEVLLTGAVVVAVALVFQFVHHLSLSQSFFFWSYSMLWSSRC